MTQREGSNLIVVPCAGGCGQQIETMVEGDRCRPCWSKKRIDELLAETEHQRSVMVQVLSDIDDWRAGAAGGSWAAVERIEKRVRDELERPDSGPPR